MADPRILFRVGAKESSIAEPLIKVVGRGLPKQHARRMRSVEPVAIWDSVFRPRKRRKENGTILRGVAHEGLNRNLGLPGDD